MKLTNLSKELGITSQQSSRHLSRLGEVGLTEKDVDSFYHLTSYGKLTVRQLHGQLFTAKHRKYFTNHSLEHLPQEFVSRIGELEDSMYVDNVMVNVQSVEKILQEAREYILNINTPYIASSFPLIRQAYERGVIGKWIHARDLALPQSMREEREREFDEDFLNKIRMSGLQEEKLVDKVDLVLYMSEKEVAILAFPLEDGSFDFLGFTSKDERARKWCCDLFYYYWDRSEPL